MVPAFTHLIQYSTIIALLHYYASFMILVTTFSVRNISRNTNTSTARRACDRQTLLTTPSTLVFVPWPTRGHGTSAERLLQVATVLIKQLMCYLH